jgi:hypothetical protein
MKKLTRVPNHSDEEVLVVLNIKKFLILTVFSYTCGKSWFVTLFAQATKVHKLKKNGNFKEI